MARSGGRPPRPVDRHPCPRALGRGRRPGTRPPLRVGVAPRRGRPPIPEDLAREALRCCPLRGHPQAGPSRSGCDPFQTAPRHRPWGEVDTVEPILPPPTPSHTWAELLRLVGAVPGWRLIAAWTMPTGRAASETLSASTTANSTTVSDGRTLPRPGPSSGSGRQLVSGSGPHGCR
jgi:hypothetical protein